MKNPLKLKEIVLEKVDMAEVMLHYNAKFAYNPKFADEAQLSCPFHGADNKPSARYYRATQSIYCWVCRKKWDVVSFIRDKEHLSFIGAINHLIDWYKLDVSSVSDDPEFELKKKKHLTIHDWENIDSSAPISRDPAEEESIRSIMLRNKIKEMSGKLPFDKYNAICSAYYMIMFEMSRGLKVFDKMNKLDSKLNIIKA
jgi:CHC2 zinc finger